MDGNFRLRDGSSNVFKLSGIQEDNIWFALGWELRDYYAKIWNARLKLF